MTHRRTWSFVALLALLAPPPLPAAHAPAGGGGAGCGDARVAVGRQGGEAPDPELAALRAWVAEITPQVEALRGLEFLEPVGLEIATVEDFRAYAERQLAAVGDAAERATVERVVKLLGLFPAGRDLWQAQLDLLEGQVGGYYEPARKSFALMSGVPPALAKTILSHELVHALEDQHYRLGERLVELSEYTDRAAAFHAVVEGTATLVANRWMLEHGQQFSMDELLDLGESNPLVEMLGAEPVLWLPVVFSYMGGQVFLHRSGSLFGAATQRFEVARLDRAFREPPRSTEQVLHPEKYWDPSALDLPSTVTLDAPAGWERLHEDVLGEVQLALVAWGDGFRAPDASDPAALFGLEYTNDAASGWDGDQLLLLRRGGVELLLLASHWDGPEDRDEWHAALGERLPALTAAAAALAGEGGSGYATAVRRGRTEHVLAVVSGPGGAGLADEVRALAEAVALEVRAEAPSPPPTPPGEEG